MKYRLIDQHLNQFTSQFLLDLYELTNDDSETIYACVPNGEIGITLILSGESYIYVNDKWEKQPHASVYGLIQKRQFIKLSKNFREITIGFSPYMLQLFLKESMSSLLKDNATDLTFLFDKYLVEKLTMNISLSSGDLEILDHISLFLSSSLCIDKYDKRLFKADKLITDSNIHNVADLSFRLNISSTGLRNIFKDKVGISPKELIKIDRIKKALKFKLDDEDSLTRLCYQLNYFDQSHFIHDFKKAIGITPKKYFQNKQLSFDFYNYARWRYDSFVEK